MKTKKLELQPVEEIAALLVDLQKTIGDDYRASEEDEEPSLSVTIGADEKGQWNYQTGDNSFTGGAYGLPFWGVVSLYRDSNCAELAKDSLDQIAEAQSW
jgi:hypothetical protein